MQLTISCPHCTSNMNYISEKMDRQIYRCCGYQVDVSSIKWSIDLETEPSPTLKHTPISSGETTTNSREGHP